MTIDTIELRELAQAARPGPWERDICQIDKMWLKGRLQECVTNQDAIVMAVTAEDDATAEYIAAANPATVLQLLDEIDRLRTIEAAARNLAKVKGRHNTEIAMNQLLEALK